MNDLFKLCVSLRYTRPRQVVRRLRLMARRWWRERLARPLRRLEGRRLPDPQIADGLPPPLFPPRTGRLRKHDDQFVLSFLNQTLTFRIPFDWHPTGLSHSSQLWRMNLHYMEYLEGVSDGDFVRIVDDWIENNPPYSPRYWHDSWNSYSLSLRCVVWMQQVAERRSRLRGSFVDRISVSVLRQLLFLERNLETDIGGNHLIKNIKALLWGARYFDLPQADAWQARCSKLLERELAEQVLADGMHFERSPSYHVQVFADLVECSTVLRDGPLRRRVLEMLSAMARVLANLTHPDGQISLFNDGGLTMSYPPATGLEVWRRISGERIRPDGIIALADAGYYGIRSRGEVILFDCGQVAPDHLPAHGHGDIFSFEWTLDGRRVVVDPGVYEYTAGPRREYSRSTAAHNTVTLDGEDQCEFWSSFRMARRARVERKSYRSGNDCLEIVGTHDGYRRLAGSPIHERRLEAVPGRIAITDRIDGGAGQRAEAHVLLHPDFHVERSNHGVILRCADVVIHLRTNAEICWRDAVWFPDFGVEAATKQIVLDYGTCPCRGEFVMERAKQ